MIVSLLQRNNFIGFILFPLLIIGLWFPYILEPGMTLYYYDQNPMPLYKPLLHLFQSNAYIGLLCMFGAMVLSMVIMSVLNSTYRMFEKRSSVYLLLFIVFSSLLPQFQQFNPMVFATIFLVMAVYSLYKLYKNEYELRAVYEAGFCFAIASLFYVHSIFLSVFIFAGIINLVPFNWRQWMSGIFGLITPYLFVVSWAFITDSLPVLLQTFEANMFVWHTSGEISTLFYVIVAYITIVFIGALLFSFSGYIKKVALQKYYFLLFLLVVFTAILYVVIPGVSIEVFYFAIIPLCFYITNYIIAMRNWLIPEIIILLLLGLRIVMVLM